MPPVMSRAPDDGTRQVAYGLDPNGKLPPGGPYPADTVAARLPALWAAGQKLLCCLEGLYAQAVRTKSRETGIPQTFF